MSPAAVTPAQRGDAEAVAHLAAAVFAETGDAWAESQYVEEIAPGGRVWVARSRHSLVGFVVLRPSDPPEVLQLAVEPDRRRQGVGRALLAIALSDAPGPVWLEVRAGNQAARRFYLDAGFEEVGQRPGYYRDGSDAVLLSRPPRVA